MSNWCICWFFTHILTKCTVQEAKSPVKISSGRVVRRDLIPALKSSSWEADCSSSGQEFHRLRNPNFQYRVHKILPFQSRTHSGTNFLKINFNFTLLSTHRFSKYPRYPKYPTKTFYAPLHDPLCNKFILLKMFRARNNTKFHLNLIVNLAYVYKTCGHLDL
jgi:hypothetical protein